MITDIHSHLLPGIDDGSRTMEETIETLRAAKQQGIDAMIMTPHFYPDGSGATAEQVRSGMEVIADAAREAGVRVYPGMECYYHTQLPSQLEKGEALTLAGSRYALIEFEEETRIRELIYALNSVADSGFVPIVAHYERYRCLMDRNNLEQVKREGFLLQMNYDTIQRVYGVLRRNPFLKHIKEGLVDFMGSDTHGTHLRPLRIVPSMEWLQDKGVLDRVNRNAERILRDEY